MTLTLARRARGAGLRVARASSFYRVTGLVWPVSQDLALVNGPRNKRSFENVEASPFEEDQSIPAPSLISNVLAAPRRGGGGGAVESTSRWSLSRWAA